MRTGPHSAKTAQLQLKFREEIHKTTSKRRGSAKRFKSTVSQGCPETEPLLPRERNPRLPPRSFAIEMVAEEEFAAIRRNKRRRPAISSWAWNTRQMLLCRGPMRPSPYLSEVQRSTRFRLYVHLAVGINAFCRGPSPIQTAHFLPMTPPCGLQGIPGPGDQAASPDLLGHNPTLQ